ncbi:type IV secretion protein Rhs [Acinetobacter sp. B10A]|uniref:type IV secretion protein Rhs n=1 Tax=Acinetobacter baretiae TaxID=2605383 RepID=UPI001B3C5702|nr:type IV secretion protein Rhs [Acinetobacter baretiae]MBF7686155.1 type IV secretion protein Rhs [Acinetobacter baretiae]
MRFTRFLHRLNAHFVQKKRQLTHGEKQLVSRVFAKSIALDQVNIVAHQLMLKNYALSPNGHIYIHPCQWQTDFSKTDIYTQSWFIHEMVHVWQVQYGLPVIRRAIFDRRYRYILSVTKHFLDYGIEQQAQMVQDHFLSCCLGQENSQRAHCVAFVRQNITTVKSF